MLIYVIYKVPFYLWLSFFPLLEGMVTYDNDLKQRKTSLKIEFNHNIILRMNYLILVSTRVPALINISTI